MKDHRFAGTEPFESKVWLATPTMHGEKQKRVDDAIRMNWVSTMGTSINRCLCLPRDNKMTPEHQDRVIEIIHRCFC